MERPKRVSRVQLPVYLECEARHQPAESTHEELVKALADLLLEALGEEENQAANGQRGGDESEDHS
jgi:hypothetical protein